MEEPVISVIVPIYNVVDYVDACVASIVNQTYPNLDIILVNDGSTDGSQNKCDEWKKKDKRIKVIHQINQGLSVARNKGTEICSGEYISFVDGDDEVDSEYIETLWKLLSSNSVRYAQCEYGEIIGVERALHGDQKTVGLMSAADFIVGPYYLTMACGKLIHKDIVQQYPFPSGKIHEDVAVMPRMCYEAGKIAYTCKSLYFYNERTESINASNRYYLKHLDILPIIENNIDYFVGAGETAIADFFRRQYIYEALSQYRKIKEYFPDRKDLLNSLKESLKKQSRQCNKDSKIKKTTWILLRMSSFFPELWGFMSKD